MPSWYNNTTRKFTGANDMKFDWVARQLDDDTEARLAALNALSAAAHKGRTEEAERELHKTYMEEEYYGHQVLLNNGICPECLWPLPDCECPKADTYTYCHECGFPLEICECEDAE